MLNLLNTIILESKAQGKTIDKIFLPSYFFMSLVNELKEKELGSGYRNVEIEELHVFGIRIISLRGDELRVVYCVERLDLFMEETDGAGIDS